MKNDYRLTDFCPKYENISQKKYIKLTSDLLDNTVDTDNAEAEDVEAYKANEKVTFLSVDEVNMEFEREIEEASAIINETESKDETLSDILEVTDNIPYDPDNDIDDDDYTSEAYARREMAETANILNRATNRSFIIFDEIGRGTATYDGMAIAQAVLEYLDAMQPRTLFATHYHELTALTGENGLQHVACLTIDVREHNNEIVFMHKIIPGIANRSYGIHVARMAGMPSSVIARAECVLSALESSEPVRPAPTCAPAPKPIRKKAVISDNLPQPQLNLFG